MLNNVLHKFKLYYGHRCRVVNQSTRLAALLEELEQACLTGDTTRAILLIDWKMKFESCGSHETSPEHYAKRGLPWLVAVTPCSGRKWVL